MLQNIQPLVRILCRIWHQKTMENQPHIFFRTIMGCMLCTYYNYGVYLLENGDSHEMWIMSVDCGEPLLSIAYLHISTVFTYRCIDYQFQTILYRSVGMISYGLRLSLRMLNVNIYIYYSAKSPRCCVSRVIRSDSSYI